MPAAAAVAAVLTALLDTLEANVPGTIRDIDTEFLHDLRVAVRRTRSALKLAGDVLPGGWPRRFRPEFKWLGDLTTPTRDLDVYLLGYGEMAAGLVAPTPPTWSRSARTCARSAPGSSGSWPAGCAPPDSRGCPGTGAAPSPAVTASRRPGAPTAARPGHQRMRRAHRRVLADGARHHRGVRPPKPCTTCASGARNCATCWRSSRSLYDPRAHWRAVRGPEGPAGLPRRVPGRRGAAGGAARVRRQMMADGSRARRDAAGHGRAGRGDWPAEQAGPRASSPGRSREFASPASERRILAPDRGGAADEDLRDVQHQGRGGKDRHRGQPRLPGRPTATGCCCGTWTRRRPPASCSGSGPGSRAAARR